MFLIVSMKIHQGKYLLMKTLTFQVMIFRNCIQDQKVHLPMIVNGNTGFNLESRISKYIKF